MNVAENKWLKRHLLHYVLRQAKNSLHWFHVWDYVLPPCFHMFMLPYYAAKTLIVGSTIGGVAQELKRPNENMILHITHAACFRKKSGQTLVAILYIFPSNERTQLGGLSSLRRHLMGVGFDGVAWVFLEDYYI